VCEREREREREREGAESVNPVTLLENASSREEAAGRDAEALAQSRRRADLRERRVQTLTSGTQRQ
jgi:hypothetical protein